MDEVDALCPVRQKGDNPVTERVVNQLLTEMDGIHQRNDIYVIAASNRPGGTVFLFGFLFSNF